MIILRAKDEQITFGKGLNAAILRAPHQPFCRGIGLHFHHFNKDLYEAPSLWGLLMVVQALHPVEEGRC
jgi:hypothetical protein